MKKNRKKELFTVITMVLCLLLFMERLTGDIWHAIIGLFLVGMMGAHVYKQIDKLAYQKPPVQLVDRMLLAVMAVVLLSGILLHPLMEVAAIKLLHKMSSVLLVIGMIVHVIQHRKRK